MSTTERRRDRAARLAGELRRQIGNELRLARRQAGLSLATVAAGCGISESELSRIERGHASWVSIETLCAIAACVGLVVSLRAYPQGSPLRDAPQRGLLGRLRAVSAPALGWRSEVPMPIPGDLRAWDAVIRGDGWWVAVEAVTRLEDVQALERRLALKLRDAGNPMLILLVSDTRSNRLALAAASSLFELLPTDARQILRALRAGQRPPGSGIVRL